MCAWRWYCVSHFHLLIPSCLINILNILNILNHTQKNIPSVVAGHQFLQSSYIGPDTGTFPITKNVIHPGFCSRTNSTFQQILFSPNCLLGICCLPQSAITDALLKTRSANRQLVDARLSSVAWDILGRGDCIFWEKCNKSSVTCIKANQKSAGCQVFYDQGKPRRFSEF